MKEIYEYLDKTGIRYKIHDHPAVFTCDDANKHYINVDGISAKTLLLRNKKKTSFFLAVIPDSKQADLKKLAEATGHKRLSFASEGDLKRLLRTHPGSVSPLALIFDMSSEITVYLDSEVMESEMVAFHPNDNTKTLDISKDDFVRFIESLSNPIHIKEL